VRRRFAFKGEGREDRAVLKSTKQVVEQSQRTGVQFLLADLAIGLTFLDVAAETQSEDTRTRNRQNARSAYDTVLRLLPRLSPSDTEQLALLSGLRELKDRLIAHGSVFDPQNE
jgi:hypothetical protein